MKTFYSCLFRANLFSRKFYERKANGEPYYYSPYDGKVYDGYMYTDNGFWDTFRSQFPLTNILHPTMQGRYMNALLAAQEQCGWLPSGQLPEKQEECWVITPFHYWQMHGQKGFVILIRRKH